MRLCYGGLNGDPRLLRGLVDRAGQGGEDLLPATARRRPGDGPGECGAQRLMDAEQNIAAIRQRGGVGLAPPNVARHFSIFISIGMESAAVASSLRRRSAPRGAGTAMGTAPGAGASLGRA